MIPPRIVGGDKYSWMCYGDNARYLDLEKNIDIIFDEETQEIYEISIHNNDGDNDDTWRSPKHEPAYLKELKEQRNLSDEEIETKKANVLYINEIMEKVKKLYDAGSIF